MTRYLVSTVLAALTLLAMLMLLARAVGPGGPAEVFIVGQLELLGSAAPEEPAERPRRPPPPERPQTDPSTH